MRILEKREIQIFLYSRRFPKQGWLQQCLCCGLPTSETEDTGYYKDLYHFFSYLCFKCKKQKHRGEKETTRIFYDTTKRYISIFLMDK